MNVAASFRRTYSHAFASDEILWGVRRRAGYSEIDDPRAYSRREAHAFIFGSDAVALCGFRPRRSWHVGAPTSLAIPTELNPRCPRCILAIRVSDTPATDHHAVAAVHAVAFPELLAAAVARLVRRLDVIDFPMEPILRRF